jgi:hypothetical protein
LHGDQRLVDSAAVEVARVGLIECIKAHRDRHRAVSKLFVLSFGQEAFQA